jgi:hypothetical protein
VACPPDVTGKLDDLIQHFGAMTARDLELRATIMFVWLDDPERSDADVQKLVQDLKPKFPVEEIKQAIAELRKNGYFQRETIAR